MMGPSDSSWFIRSHYTSVFFQHFSDESMEYKVMWHRRISPTFSPTFAPLPLREEVLYNPSASSPGLASYGWKICWKKDVQIEQVMGLRILRLFTSVVIICHLFSYVFMLCLLTILVCLYYGIERQKSHQTSWNSNIAMFIFCNSLYTVQLWPRTTGALRQDHGMSWQRLGSRFRPSMKNSSPQWIHTWSK